MKPALPLAAIALSMLAAHAHAGEANTCKAMTWTTMGTAGGPVPTPERGEPSNLLRVGETTILVDSGDGAANRLARAGSDVGKLDAVMVSHLHWDHVGGLGAVIGLFWMNEYPGVLTVYGPKGTASVVAGIVASLEVPSQIGFGIGSLPPRPADKVRVIELGDGDMATIGGVEILAATNNHFYKDGKPAVDATESLSFRFASAGRTITYTGDTGPDGAVTRLAQGTDMLVSEVIALDPLVKAITHHRPDMPKAVQAQMYEHLSTHHVAPDAVGVMARDAGVKRLVLTHYAVPGPLDANADYLTGGVRQHYDGPLDLSRDGDDFTLECE